MTTLQSQTCLAQHQSHYRHRHFNNNINRQQQQQERLSYSSSCNDSSRSTSATTTMRKSALPRHRSVPDGSSSPSSPLPSSSSSSSSRVPLVILTTCAKNQALEGDFLTSSSPSSVNDSQNNNISDDKINIEVPSSETPKDNELQRFQRSISAVRRSLSVPCDYELPRKVFRSLEKINFCDITRYIYFMITPCFAIVPPLYLLNRHQLNQLVRKHTGGLYLALFSKK